MSHLVAFDLDGTLVDSRRDLAESANQMVVELGGRALSQETVVGMVGEGASVLVRKALAAADLPDSPAALGRFLQIYDERLLQFTEVYPGVRDLVETARGSARLSVLTNKPLHHTERLLEGLGIRQLFDDVVGGDGPHPRKPSPDGLRALMAAADATEATTLMVGDSLVDFETARNAGTGSCLVAWGFGFSRIPAGTLARGQWIARDPAELAERIVTWRSVVR